MKAKEMAYIPRFRREPKGNIRITERDGLILEQIYRFRLLRTNQICNLLKVKNHKQIRDRLKKLYHHGFVTRIREHVEMLPNNKPLIYAVDNKGVELLILKNRIPSTARKHDWSENNRRLKSLLFLNHTLLVAEIMIAFEVACKKTRGVKFISPEDILKNAPEDVRQSKKPFSWKINIIDNGRNYDNLGVEPDWAFGLSYKNNSKEKIAYFFLEADNGTMALQRKTLYQTSIFKKFLTYYTTYKTKEHIKRFNIKNFRVLTVTTTSERAKNMFVLNKKIGRGGGSNLFLFTDKNTLFEAKNPLKVLWKSGGQEKRVRLI